MQKLTGVAAILAIVATASLVPSQAQVTWGASNSNGLGDASGVGLPIGNLVEIGTFNLTDSQIQQLQFDVPALSAAFVRFDTALIGDDVGIPAYWNKQSDGSTDALGLNHRQIYYWAFNAPTTTQATQQGIFTANNNARWIFPADGDVPNTTTVDLEDVNDIIVGGFGTGFTNPFGSPVPLFNLAPIPETPGSGITYALLCASLAGIVRYGRFGAKLRRR
jgi:hypothetical protein